MNHKLIRMMEEAGFPFTPDTMAKLPEFEKLVGLEREACAKLMGELTCMGNAKECFEVAATYIRARGQG